MFQKVMDTVLRGIPRVICYIDDILVTGTTREEHLSNLEQVLARLQKHGLRFNKPKCKYLKPSVNYLGLIVNAEGVHTSDEKIRAVIEVPQPRNVKELRSFLGMMNYYRKFIPNLATVLKPLTSLLQLSTRWHWSTQCAKAFQKPNNCPVLVHYDTTLPMRLATDASSHGVGAVISHILPNGEEKPIAYTSRTLSASECNYAQIEKEALGIIFGIRRFHQYLYGRKFILTTDHKPLTSIFGAKKGVPALAAARLQRWAIQLSAYNYEIKFRATDKHGNTDRLSRFPLPEIGPEEGVDVKVFQIHQLESLPITCEHVKKAVQSSGKS